MPEDINAQDKNIITKILQTFVESFNARYHISVEVRLTCTEEYEKQREHNKQGAIKQYDQMDKNDRHLYRELKERGLQNLFQQRGISLEDDDSPGQNESLNSEIVEVHEVDKDFADYQGENPDIDDDTE